MPFVYRQAHVQNRMSTLGFTVDFRKSDQFRAVIAEGSSKVWGDHSRSGHPTGVTLSSSTISGVERDEVARVSAVDFARRLAGRWQEMEMMRPFWRTFTQVASIHRYGQSPSIGRVRNAFTLLVNLRAQPGDLALGYPAHAHSLDQVVDRAGRDTCRKKVGRPCPFLFGGGGMVAMATRERWTLLEKWVASPCDSGGQRSRVAR